MYRTAVDLSDRHRSVAASLTVGRLPAFAQGKPTLGSREHDLSGPEAGPAW